MQMTYSQIKSEVGNAWAFLSNPEYQNGLLQSAELLFFDENKVKVTEQLKKHTKGHYAMVYFGEINTEQAYLL